MGKILPRHFIMSAEVAVPSLCPDSPSLSLVLYQQGHPFSLTKEYFSLRWWDVAFFFFFQCSIKLFCLEAQLGGDCRVHYPLCRSEQLHHSPLWIFLNVFSIAEAGIKAQFRCSATPSNRKQRENWAFDFFASFVTIALTVYFYWCYFILFVAFPCQAAFPLSF